MEESSIEALWSVQPVLYEALGIVLSVLADWYSYM